MNRLAIGFGAASALAIALGCIVAANAQVPVAIWIRNPAAWIAGAALAVAIIKSARRSCPEAWLAVAMLSIAATLVSPGIDGVYRWIMAGPVQVNVAALLLPAAIVALVSTGFASLATLAIMVMLVVQPDASQATAFAAGSILLLARRGRPGIAAGSIVAILAAASWLRADPLLPVAEVEGIVALAWGQSPALAIAVIVASAASALSPALLAPSDDEHVRAAARALSAYLVLTILAPAVGAFPVPLVGMGMSPIVGSWLGLACLTLLARLNKAGGAAPSGFR